MRYRLIGDIIRAGSIEVEAASLEDLEHKLDAATNDGGVLDLDVLVHEVTDECKRCAVFDLDGTIFDENNNEVRLPSAATALNTGSTLDDRNPHDSVEFTESPEGERAKEKWAERYEECDGAPESDDDR